MTPQLVLTIVVFTAPVFAVALGTWAVRQERKRRRELVEAIRLRGTFRQVYPEPLRLYDAERWTDHH